MNSKHLQYSASAEDLRDLERRRAQNRANLLALQQEIETANRLAQEARALTSHASQQRSWPV